MQSKIFNIVLLFLVPTLLFSAATKLDMLQDLEVIKNTFHVKYAPRDWKKQHLDWDLDKSFAAAMEQVEAMEEPDVKTYQNIVAQLLQSMNDVHVSVGFYSTEASFLPFIMKEAENRFFVSSCPERLAEALNCPLKKGDEILAINQVPVNEVLSEIMQQQGYKDTPTWRAIAALYMTMKSGMQGLKIEKGEVTLTVKRLGTGKVEEIATEWLYLPEKVTNGFTPSEEETSPDFRINMSTPLYQQLQDVRKEIVKKFKMQEDDDLDFIGMKKSFVPVLGDVVWRGNPNGFFHAYIYQTKDRHQVGYIRIPGFNPLSIEDAMGEFAAIIEEFEDETDALVIDVVDNPGGVGQFMFGLSMMLTDKPLIPPKFRETITQKDVYYALNQVQLLEMIDSDFLARLVLGDSYYGLPVTLELVQSLAKHLRLIIEEWNNGNRYTSYDYLMGLGKLRPNLQVRYTKPIMILTNHLSISCGDFFPALLQDNKRALIFGTRTAGAGGGVAMHRHPNFCGILYYSCTESIAERLNKEPIEDLGVRPDIQYEVTVQDIQNKYKGYKEAVNRALQKAFFQ